MFSLHFGIVREVDILLRLGRTSSGLKKKNDGTLTNTAQVL